MFTPLLHWSLIDGAVPIAVDVLAFAALVAVVLRRPFRRSVLVFGVAAVVGALIAFGLAWYLGDVKNDFGIILAFSTRAWFAAGAAGAAIAIVSLWRARGWRIPVGIAAIAIFALLAAVGINATIGQYPTLADALGTTKIHILHISAHSSTARAGASLNLPLWETWKPPATMPLRGSVGTVTIPATLSHFVARKAIVYLPPAALVADPPKLPVLEFLGGQPGSPETVITAGQLPEVMNAFAAAHHGLAPIVVMPDQLGSSAANPMCLNSPLGNVATYVTEDVPNWIRAHLNVDTARDDWAIGGFSEGGTCSIQIGTTDRTQFGGILDISGQVAPLNRSVAHTIRVGFHGSVAAYNADTAPALLAAGAPFATTVGVFAVGANDAKYGPETAIVERAARIAHMDVHPFVSPGTAHDWFTEQYGLRMGVPVLAQGWGLAQ
jgi:hypothetical protein